MAVVAILILFLIFGKVVFADKSIKPDKHQPICLNMLHGTIVHTGDPLDLAIEGDGYIVLNDGQQDLYSRGRSLAVNAYGYLVDPFTGYWVQRIGSTGEDDGFQVPGDDNIYMPYDIPVPPKATSMIVVQGNLSPDATLSLPQTQVLRSNIRYTVYGFTTAVTWTKIVDLDQFSGAPSDGRIYVDGIKPDGTEVIDNTGLIVTATTTLEDLLSYIDNKFGAGNVTASLVAGRIRITDDSPGYSRTDIMLSYVPGGSETFATPAYFEVTVVGGEEVKNVNIIIYDSIGGTHVLSAAFVRADTPNIWDLVLTSICPRPSFTSNGMKITNFPVKIQQNYDISSTELLLTLRTLPIDPNLIKPMLPLPIDPNLIVIRLPLPTIDPNLIVQPIPVPIPMPVSSEPDNIHEITFDGRRIEGIEFNGHDGSFAGLNSAVGDTAEFVITFKYDTSNPQVVTIDMGTVGQFDGLTQFVGTSTAVAKAQDGYEHGNLVSVSVKNDGVIRGTFSNGIKRDIATIKMAMFDNVCGLESIGNGYFLSSDESGEAITTQATFNGAGAIRGEALEEFSTTKVIKNVIDKIEELLEEEWLVDGYLEIMQAGGDYGDLTKADVIKAKQKIHSAMRHQQQALTALEKSIENLEEVLLILGVEPAGN